MVTTEHQGEIAIITINNPPVNALSPGVPEGIAQALREASNNAATRAIVVIGGGTTFIAGADIKQLEDLGNAAVPALRKALEKNPSLEVRRRLETLLSRQPSLVSSPETLRCLRAIQVLERIASKEAERFLAELARGMAYAPETLEAKAAQERLSRRAARPR